MSTNENPHSLSSSPNKGESSPSILTNPLEITNWSENESKRPNPKKHITSSYITSNPVNQDEIIDESLSDRLSTLDGWNSKPQAKFVDVRNFQYSEQEGQAQSHQTEFINIFKNDLTNLSHGLHIMDVKGKQRNSMGIDSNSPSKNHSKTMLTGPRRISISQQAESRRASNAKIVPHTQETQKSDIVLIRNEVEKKSIRNELVDEITNFRPSTSNMDNLQRGGIESKRSQRDGKFQVKPILEMEKLLENATPKDKFSNMNMYRDTIQRIENLKKQNDKTSSVRKATPPKPFSGVAGAYLPSVGQGKKKNFRINNRALNINKSAFNLDESYIMRNHKERPDISTHNLSVDAIFGASSYPSSRPLTSLLKAHKESEDIETRPRKQSIGKPSSQPIISFDASYFSHNPNLPKETVSLTSSINFVCSILKSSSVQALEEPKKTPNNKEQKKPRSRTNLNSSSSQASPEMTAAKPAIEETFVPYSIQETANGYGKILIDTEKRFEVLNLGRPGTRSSSVQRGKRSPDGKFKSREETGVEIKLYNWPIPSVIPPEKKYEIEKGLKFTRKNELQAAWDKFMKKKIKEQTKEDAKEESFDYKLEPSGKIRIKNLAFTPNISNVNSINARKAREGAKDKISSRRELRSANPSETKRNYYKGKDRIFL